MSEESNPQWYLVQARPRQAAATGDAPAPDPGVAALLGLAAPRERIRALMGLVSQPRGRIRALIGAGE